MSLIADAINRLPSDVVGGSLPSDDVTGIGRPSVTSSKLSGWAIKGVREGLLFTSAAWKSVNLRGLVYGTNVRGKLRSLAGSVERLLV